MHLRALLYTQDNLHLLKHYFVENKLQFVPRIMKLKYVFKYLSYSTNPFVWFLALKHPKVYPNPTIKPVGHTEGSSDTSPTLWKVFRTA